MAEQLKNSLDNPTSTLAAGISSGALSLTVAAGHGARLPASGNFRLKLTDQADDSLYELVVGTARATDVVTITRAAEGTTARAFVTGDHVDLVLSAAAVAAYVGENSAQDADITSAIAALSSVYQPLDSDLTAIAALATTSFGRGLLTLADAAALLSAAGAQASDSDLTAIAALAPANDDVVQRKAGAWTNRTMAQLIADLGALGTTFQPLDSDLTAIAALSTTAFGRALLALADAAALRTAAGLVIGTDIEAHDTDLTTIAGLSPSNDDFLQRKSGAWANRTVAQVLADLAAAGTTFQPLDATLTALAAANWAANALPIGTGADTLSQTSFAANTFPARASTGNLVAKAITDAGLALVDDADASAMRTTLGLVIGTDVAPANPGFVTFAAESGLSAEHPLGSDVIMSGTLAGRPAAATAGRLYWATDGGGANTGVMYRDTGAAWVIVSPGAILDRVTITSNVTSTQTTRASADTVLTGASITYDGSTAVRIVVFGVFGNSTTTQTNLTLWEDSTDLTVISPTLGVTTGTGLGPLIGVLVRTPTAGAKVHSLRMYVSSASTGTVYAGAGTGGSGVPPTFMMIERL